MSHSIYAFQAVPPPDTATTVQEAPPPAQAPAEPGGMNIMFLLIMFVPLFLIMFWQSRSQQKKQEAAVAALKKGDKVLTQSGLVGRLAEIDTRYAKLELAPGVKVSVLRTSLAGRDSEDTAATAKSSDKAAKKDDKNKE